MRVYFNSVRVFCFASLLALNISCQDQRDRRPITEHVKEPSEAKIQDLGSNARVGDDRSVSINADGWKLPSLSLFLQKSKRMLVEDGGARIEKVEYSPSDDVIQIADGNTFIDLARDSEAGDKSWLIRYLRVFSAKDKPFCYLMRGNLVTLDQEGHIENRLAMSIVLVYSDEDGDGVFETFRYSSSESPSIPGWVRAQQ